MRTVLIAAILALATPALALDDPDALVKSLYKLKQIPLKSKEIDRYFAKDLAAAIKKDIAPKDEVGLTNDGDYRYDAQDMEISGLAFSKTANTVTATFKNYGKAGKVTYAMCMAKDGWRIADVTSASGDMRKLLKLPAAVKC